MPDPRLERLRLLANEAELGVNGAGTANGIFAVEYRGALLRIIASAAEIGDPELRGWEHVSVSLARRCPTWDEMCYVKDLFWLPEEAVMQLHPPKSGWVNNHPYCLHLWRPTLPGLSIPLPPPILVGLKSVGELRGPAHARKVREKFFNGEISE